MTSRKGESNEETTKREDEEGSAGRSSSLAGLFDPPASSSGATTTAAAAATAAAEDAEGRRGTVIHSNSSAASQLMGLFSDPTIAAAESSTAAESQHSSPEKEKEDTAPVDQLLVAPRRATKVVVVQAGVDETMSAPMKTTAQLEGLFTQPPFAASRNEEGCGREDPYESTTTRCNNTRTTSETSRLLPVDKGRASSSGLPSMFEVPISGGSEHPEQRQTERVDNASWWSSRIPSLPVLARECISQLLQPTTWIGSFMFLLYHVVFCLAQGAAITRPHGESPVFGIMTKMSASGVIFGAVVYWWFLSDDIPALYPALDLFTAPFLANLAVIVDDVLYHDSEYSQGSSSNDGAFLATFTLLMCLGLIVTSTLLMLGNVFKLANLGAFLPSPVLSGFFAAVGVLLWTLAVKVDTGGTTVGQIITSGDLSLVLYALKHHTPSLVVACAMKYASPMNPLYVVLMVFGTIAAFYLYMFLVGASLQDMVQNGWFWSKDELFNSNVETASVGFGNWAPPAPGGWINSWWQGKVHWGAVQAGLPTTIALGFLYMIRCSLHGAALKKNVTLMERFVTIESKMATVAASIRDTLFSDGADTESPRPRRRMSEDVDIDAVVAALHNPSSPNRGSDRTFGEMNKNNGDDQVTTEQRHQRVAIIAQPSQHTLTGACCKYRVWQIK